MFSHLRIFVILLTTSIIGALAWAKYDITAQNNREKNSRSIIMQLIAPPPSIGQQALEVAVEAFHVRRDVDAPWPHFNQALDDRGLTEKRAFEYSKIVKIGPSAFESWSILGSTLAHELEIHCNQNFFLITLADYFGLQGTNLAEREAYLWEITQAKRFGLIKSEAFLIESTLNRYYPLDFTQNNRPEISRLLARYLVRASTISR